jgi:hypothetical protein
MLVEEIELDEDFLGARPEQKFRVWCTIPEYYVYSREAGEAVRVPARTWRVDGTLADAREFVGQAPTVGGGPAAADMLHDAQDEQMAGAGEALTSPAPVSVDEPMAEAGAASSAPACGVDEEMQASSPAPEAGEGDLPAFGDAEMEGSPPPLLGPEDRAQEEVEPPPVPALQASRAPPASRKR